MPSGPPRLLDMPGLAGPNMLGTIAFRNAMQLGYGVNVLLQGGGSVSFLLGPSAAAVWAWLIVVASAFALAGVYVSSKTGDTRLELWSSIAIFGTFMVQCSAVMLCGLYGLGPNGFLPFWWPAALAAQGLWRIRNIVRTEQAKEASRHR